MQKKIHPPTVEQKNGVDFIVNSKHQLVLKYTGNNKNKKNYPEDEYKNKSELNSLHTNDCDKQKKLDGKTPSLKKLKETTRTNGGLLDDEFQLFPPFQKEFFSGIIKGLGGTIKNKWMLTSGRG